MLPKYVFPKLYTQFQLNEDELESKCMPYAAAVAVRWKKEVKKDTAIKAHGTGLQLVKLKWTDRFYLLGQDYCMAMTCSARACWMLSIIGFVRSTCSRSGSFGKDYADRVGKTAWSKMNVLSVQDFSWSVQGMVIEETEEVRVSEAHTCVHVYVKMCTYAGRCVAW